MVRRATQLIKRVKVLVLVVHAELSEVTCALGVVDPFDLHKLKNTLAHELVQPREHCFGGCGLEVFSDWTRLNHES